NGSVSVIGVVGPRVQADEALPARVAADDFRLQGEEARTVADRDDVGIGILRVTEAHINLGTVEWLALFGVMQQIGRFLPETRLISKLDEEFGYADDGKGTYDRQQQAPSSLGRQDAGHQRYDLRHYSPYSIPRNSPYSSSRNYSPDSSSRNSPSRDPD